MELRGFLGRWCNAMVVILNTGIFIFSVLMLRFSSDEPPNCDKLVAPLFFVVGASMLVVSVLGIVGAAFRISSLLWLYLAASFFVVLGLSSFTAFLFVAVRKGNGGGENPLGGYSPPIQQLVNGDNWRSIQSCLRESKLCAGRLESPRVQSDFYKNFIAPLKMGCCEKTKACLLKDQQGDCVRWGDEADALCFACDSCKAAILSNFQMDWIGISRANIYLISFLTLVPFFGCCSLWIIHQEKHNRYRHQQC